MDRIKMVSILIVICLLITGAVHVSALSEEKPFQIFEKELSLLEKEDYVKDEILIKFKRGVSEEKIKNINSKHGTSVIYTSPYAGFKLMKIPGSKTVDEIIEIYRKNPNVEYAVRNSIVHAYMVPNDPIYSYQWHFTGINMEQAWDLSDGTGAVVAVLDSGVAYENYDGYVQAPDLANTNFVSGWDFVNNDGHPNDDNGHGTHVTGTIAQSTNNNLGVAGVAFNSTIMPVRVLNQNGDGTTQWLVDSIYFATNNGADIISMSLGYDPMFYRNIEPPLKNALDYAYSNGVTCIAASGNDGMNSVSYPAAYPTCIAVGATRFDDTKARYSNSGNELDIVAPGGDITVDQNGDGFGDGVLQNTFGSNPKDFGYYFYQGTSMATPHVSGVAALLIARGVTGPDNIKNALISTARDLGKPGWDSKYGWGIVDAYAALQLYGNIHDVAVTSITPDWVTSGSTASIDVTVENQGTYSETFNVELYDETTLIGTQSGINLNAGTSTIVSFTWDTTSASPGTHTLTATAGPVLDETETGDNTLSKTVEVREASHDVAVTSITAPASVYQGDIAQADVTVENQGTYSETFNVELTDQTDAYLIGTETVTLDPGSSTTLTFNWDTTSATLGIHTLISNAGPAEGETDTADNSLSTISTVMEPPAGVTVNSISPNWVYAGQTDDVIVSGAGFADGATLTFENGDGPSPAVSNVLVVSTDTITATISAKVGGPLRDRIWDVRVTNPDGGTGVLAGGFTVRPTATP